MIGLIRRRLLVNYRVDPEVVQRLLPARFRPKLHQGQAVAGMCLIRLEQIRPLGLPGIVGITSENAAHRIAVRWDEPDGLSHEGVYIPRRDTNSTLNHFLGGKLFPGEQNLATFQVTEAEDRIDFSMQSHDETTAIELKGKTSLRLPETSIFESVSAASAFFEPGAVGYSPRSNSDDLDAIKLETLVWRVEPLAIEQLSSSFFADEKRFPKGSVVFDHTLMMRNIEHKWHTA